MWSACSYFLTYPARPVASRAGQLILQVTKRIVFWSIASIIWEIVELIRQS